MLLLHQSLQTYPLLHKRAWSMATKMYSLIKAKKNLAGLSIVFKSSNKARIDAEEDKLVLAINQEM